MKDLELANILAQASKELSTEIRPIPSFSNDYFASSHGHIFSLKTGKLKELKQADHWKGYKFVSLYRNAKREQYKVHRLILWSFLGHSVFQVNHIDGDKTNNKLENLEYVTASENALHAYRLGLRRNFCGQPSGKDHWTQKTILRKSTKENANERIIN